MINPPVLIVTLGLVMTSTEPLARCLVQVIDTSLLSTVVLTLMISPDSRMANGRIKKKEDKEM